MCTSPTERRVRVARLAPLALALLSVLCATSRVRAQTPDTLVAIPAVSDTIYEIQVAGGTTVYARVAGTEGGYVLLTTVGGGRVVVERSEIRSIAPARGRMVEGEFWREDPNVSRLFFTATGRSLPTGEGYIGTYLVILPFFAVGVTDAITLAAGAPLTVGELQPFYVAPKVRLIHVGNEEQATDISVGTLLFINDDDKVGILYGVGTMGNRDNAVTLGVGFGYSGTDFASQPVGMFGAEFRVGRRTKFLTENYILPEGVGVLASGGLRIMGERFSTDLGMMGAFTGEDAGCCLPLINFSYALGRR